MVAAAGAPHMIKAADLKPGAIVLDVGVSRVDDGTGKAGSPETSSPPPPTSPPGSRRTPAAWVR